MRLLPALVSLFAALAGCSPSSPPPQQAPESKAVAGSSAPANAVLGSAEWYAWVDQTLGINDDAKTTERGSAAWDQAVQEKLGQEAPQSKPGTPEWQQAVDALLRTRAQTSQ